MPSPSGASAERKRWLMRGRLFCNNGKEAALLRRRRRKAAKVEVREVIKSFIGEADVEGVRGEDEPVHNRQATDDDDDCELFWANLPVEVSRERHILNIPTRPERCYLGRAVKSREVM